MSTALDIYTCPPRESGEVPRPELKRLPDGSAYNAWTRPRAHTAFFMGLQSAAFLLLTLHPGCAIFALGFGLAAVVLAYKEIDEYPTAARSSMLRWAKVCGWLGLIGGPVAIVTWIAAGIALFVQPWWLTAIPQQL